MLLGPDGERIGVAPKATVHQGTTPLHLAFSCYVFDVDDRLLITRRALTKRTWPGFWTNSFCGHPQPYESIGAAADRRAREELGIQVTDMWPVLPGFAYSATYAGIEENEVCPVLVARTTVDPTPEPAEVADWAWTTFEEFAARTDTSPWAQHQVQQLRALGTTSQAWAEAAGRPAA